jgi:hypothetical protein
MRHLGNAFALDRSDPQKMDLEAGANRSELPSRVQPKLHLQPHSDLVALMVLEHQIRVHNLITKANYEARQAIAMDVSMNQALGRDSGYRSESTQRRIQSAASSLADAILMRNESPLEQVVQGTSSFAEVFASQGPWDSQNRSLRQFDLQTRLFRHRLSYLIYTPEFQALPKDILEPLREHLQETLRTDEYRAEREILEDTLPGWLSAS